MAFDPKIDAPRRFRFTDPNTAARICASEWCMDDMATYMVGREMPWQVRGPHKLLLSWPMFNSDGTPRSPRGPTSGTPAAGYRECWGRVRTAMQPATILTYQTTGDPPEPDLTVCPNGPANRVGVNCTFPLDFGVGGGIGYPSLWHYATVEPEPRVRRRQACGKVCACCPCDAFCLYLPGFTAPLFIGGIPITETSVNFPGTGADYLCIENSNPVWTVINSVGGWAWVVSFTDDPCGPNATSGTIDGVDYTIALSSMIVWSAPRGWEDCYITVVYTWLGFFLGASDGDSCFYECSGGVLTNTGDPGCTPSASRGFSVTGTVSFGINACPPPDDPSPQVADVADMILQPNIGAWAFGSPSGGNMGLACNPGADLP